jgi:hypothetical protein
MSTGRKIKQEIIPQKIVEMAKAIQRADQNKQELVIIQKRQWGKTAAYKLARNNN